MKFTPCLIGALALLSLSSLNAALMVDWGGNYANGPRAYSNPNPSNAIGVTEYGGFSSGNPLLLSPSANYSGTSATFYGQIVRTAGTSTFTSDPSGNLGGTAVTDNSGNDRLSIKLDGTPSGVSALFLWKQTDFLNGLNTGALNLAAGSTVSTTRDTYVLGVPGRAVVKSAGSYYISSAIFSGTGTSTFDLTTLSWSEYDPAGDGISSIGSTFGLVSGGVISNVTEIGFFTGVTAGTNAVRLSSVEFNYVAAAIPEPSSFALLAGGTGLVFALRRKRVRA